MTVASEHQAIVGAAMRFGLGLSAALLIPAVLLLIIIGTLLSGALPSRSPYVAFLAVCLGALSLAELAAASIAVVRLVRNPPLRGSHNLALTGLSFIAVLPSLVMYVNTLYG